MTFSLNLYDALTAISIPAGKAKGVVDAWEDEMQNFATKSDLLHTETRLNASISELRTDMNALGVELRALIKEQGAELRESMATQNSELRELISTQGSELRELISTQGAELRESIAKQGADLRSSIISLEAHHKLVHWQFGIIFLCISIPSIKLAYDFLSKAFLG
ncbi:DUF1640 domain-containing protein [Pseudomonas gingeri NCPPB 3146 = LMG 5327]|uniref:Apolipoprotein A1/A4/E family protein n=2 Tax=Pseudomonas gingeri TaxID=117681 RepID=A0A7Y7XUD4_9PSED|nr:hypothetical protein [Pseudomonas gingeri]NWC12261.1 apolipoprotein A1/A4/E family protein [Pseudomonas gingeri]PNQ88734.1 DUF1640 domain-containing protein [Pseudomonas gingeri NCPPB 3146 = LMG 5327]